MTIYGTPEAGLTDWDLDQIFADDDVNWNRYTDALQQYVERSRAALAAAEERERVLRALLREAQGYLNKGLNIYDEIDDALAQTPGAHGEP